MLMKTTKKYITNIFNLYMNLKLQKSEKISCLFFCLVFFFFILLLNYFFRLIFNTAHRRPLQPARFLRRVPGVYKKECRLEKAVGFCDDSIIYIINPINNQQSTINNQQSTINNQNNPLLLSPRMRLPSTLPRHHS